MNIRKNNGITLMALVITIILLIIISGISITGTIRGQEETEENTKITEMYMIQHAILEKYTKSKLTNEKLPGTDISIEEVNTIIKNINSKTGEKIVLKGKEYKRLSETDLETLGIIQEEDTYIVNYKTGEVINETVKITSTGRALYIYATSEN